MIIGKLDADGLKIKEVDISDNEPIFCEVCGKGELSGNNVSHSHLKTKRSWKPNIQRVRAVVNGEIKRVNVCTRCLRSGKVERSL